MKFCSCGNYVMSKKCPCMLKTLKPIDFWDPCTIKRHEKANWSNNFCELRKQWSNIGKCGGSCSADVCSNCDDKWNRNCTFCCCNSLDGCSPQTSSSCMCSVSKCRPHQEKQYRCSQVSNSTNSCNKTICGTLNDLLNDLTCLTDQIRSGLQTIDITCQEMNSEINNSIETSIEIIENIISLSQETCKRNQDLINSYLKLTNLKEKMSHMNGTENNDNLMKNYNTLKQMASVIQNIADQNRNSNNYEQIITGPLQIPESQNQEIINRMSKAQSFQNNPSKSHLNLRKSSKSLYEKESPLNEQFFEQIPKNIVRNQSRKTLNFQPKSSKSVHKPNFTSSKETVGSTSDKYKNQKSSKSLQKIQNQDNTRRQNGSIIAGDKRKSSVFSGKPSSSRIILETAEVTLDNNPVSLRKSTTQGKFSKSFQKFQNPNISEQIIQNIPNQKRKSLNFAQKSFHKTENMSGQNIKNEDNNFEEISSESLLNLHITPSLVNEYNRKMNFSKQSMKSRPEIVISEQNLDNAENS